MKQKVQPTYRDACGDECEVGEAEALAGAGQIAGGHPGGGRGVERVGVELGLYGATHQVDEGSPEGWVRK